MDEAYDWTKVYGGTATVTRPRVASGTGGNAGEGVFDGEQIPQVEVERHLYEWDQRLADATSELPRLLEREDLAKREAQKTYDSVLLRLTRHYKAKGERVTVNVLEAEARLDDEVQATGLEADLSVRLVKACKNSEHNLRAAISGHQSLLSAIRYGAGTR